MILNQSLWVGSDPDGAVCLLPANACRHGLISGATGTGKTVTLQVLAEGFSALGVPVFLADVKGDLGGLAREGGGASLASRLEKCGASQVYAPRSFPTVFWDVYGEKGHPIRTTVTEMGPLLLSRLLGLNDVQSGVMYLVFRIADQEGLLLIDLKDLKSVLGYVGENAARYTLEYGNISKATIGAIQRAVAVLEDQGGNLFFGEPALDIADFFCQDGSGRGVINLLQAQRLFLNPVMYSTFLLWLLSEIYETLPEAGALDKPRMVFFFDEAHLLFKDTSKALMDRLEQTVKLIRSKGVGLYFVTQSPTDVPSAVLSQLNNRVQHALRAYTPAEIKILRAAADTFRANPAFDTEEALGQLATGEALVSFLDEKGVPCPCRRALILPPQSRIGVLTDEELSAGMKADAVGAKYDASYDRESAYEVLARALSGEDPGGVLQPLPTQADPLALPGEDASPVFRVFDPVSGTYVERQSLPPLPVQPVSPAVPSYSAPARQTYSTPVSPKTTVRAVSGTSRSRQQTNLAGSFARSAVNSAARALGSELTRGLMETLGLRKRRRR